MSAPLALLAALISAAVLTALLWLLVAATSPCASVDSFPSGLTGWQGNVKCYKGEVVDYR